MGRIPTQAFPGSARNSDETELLPRSSACGLIPVSRAACSRTWLPRKRIRRTREQDAQPGKVLHETRAGEMAAWARFRSSVTTAASTQHHFSSCSPARTTRARVTARSLSLFGRTSSARWRGSIIMATSMATASWNMLASRNSVSSTKVGRTPTMRFSTRTAHPPKDQSLCAKCKATFTPPSWRRPNWLSSSAMMQRRATCRSRRKPCSDDSKRVSGVTNFPHTRLRSMAESSPARCERRTQVTVFSLVSRPRSMPVAWRRRSQMKLPSPVGEFGRSLRARRVTIRCRITTDRSGHTTTR